MPRLLQAAAAGRPATVYGTDYPTADGTAVRDYVHVADIADAHVRAALALHRGEIRDEVLNIGRGEGASVLQMIDAVAAALGRPLPYAAAPRRAGDPAEVVASPDRIRDLLGWHARHDLDDIVRSAAGDHSPPGRHSAAGKHSATGTATATAPETHTGQKSRNKLKNTQR